MVFTTASTNIYRLMKKRGLNLSLLDEVFDALATADQAAKLADQQDI